MLLPFNPLLRINQAWLAERVRSVKDRLAGAFANIVNIIPNLADGIGRVRPGYELYGSLTGGPDIPSGMEVLRVHGIQHPQDDDFHLFFVNNVGTLSVQHFPHYIDHDTIGTSRQTETVSIVNSLLITTAYSLGGANNQLSFSGAERAAAQLVGTTGYYNNWLVYNIDRNNYAIIKTYTVSGGATIEFVEDIHTAASNLGWVAGDDLVMFANFHDNPYHPTAEAGAFATGFNPQYNDDKENPPTSIVENSTIRLSGGQAAQFNNRGVWLHPRLTRTFFPSVSGRSLTFRKTYASERECKVVPTATLFNTSDIIDSISGGGDTERVVPVADGRIDTGVSWTNSGTESAYQQIDDGLAPNDANYVEVAAGFDVTMEFPVTALTETRLITGSNVITVRLRVTASGGDQGRLVIAYGEYGSSLILGDTSGLTTLTLTTPQSNLDENFHRVRIRWIGNHSGTSSVLRITNLYVTLDTLSYTNVLTEDRSYFIGVAPIYDGYQCGRLRALETGSDYGNVSGDWVNNYLRSGPGQLVLKFRISLAKLNKRITGFAIYGAIEDGQQTIRTADYRFLKQFSVTEADTFAASWVYGGTDGTFTQSITIGKKDFDEAGSTYFTDAGYPHDVFDIMYAYSHELTVAGRKVIADVYDSNNLVGVDKDNIFTNPVGGNDEINAGVVQPDIFPDMEGIYRLRVDPTVGSQLNGMAPIGVDEFLALKDKGVIRCRMLEIGGLPNLTQAIVAPDVGLATVGEYAIDDAGVVYFPGFDDIYAYREGNVVPLIEREDKNDWLDSYKNAITITQKEAATFMYLPELDSLMVMFGNVKAGSDYSGLQYLWHRGRWVRISLKETANGGVPTLGMRWKTNLRNGHTVCISTESTPAAYRMVWKYNGGSYIFTYLDNTTPIVPYFDTGYFLGHPEGADTMLRKYAINRTLTDGTTASTLAGSLDIDLYADESDSAAVQSFSGVASTKNRITLRTKPTKQRRAQSWRIIFNKHASNRERLTAGKVYHINSIELFGEIAPRVRSDGE